MTKLFKKHHYCSLAVVAALAIAPFTAMAQPKAGDIEEDSLKGETLTFVSYGGIFQDGQIAALEEFVKKSGVKLLEDGPTEIAKLRAQVEANNVQWDVVDTGVFAPYIYCGSLFQKLDFSKIDISNIPEGQVGECSVPAMNYATLFVYNKEKYADNPPKSWADFFDIEKFPGTRAISGVAEPSGAILEQALLADGVSKEDLFPADIDRALNKFRSMGDDLFFWQTGAQSQQMIESGEADMVVAWSGRAMAAVKNGANYAPVWDDWLIMMDQITIPVGVKNSDASYALINAYLGKRAQEIVAEETSYSPIHKDAEPNVDELTGAWLTNTPEKLAQAYQQNVEYWVEHYGELGEKWAEFIAGN